MFLILVPELEAQSGNYRISILFIKSILVFLPSEFNSKFYSLCLIRAINELWPKEVKGFVNVDISNEINSLSERIVNILYPKFEGILYRQFMPMSLRVRNYFPNNFF